MAARAKYLLTQMEQYFFGEARTSRLGTRRRTEASAAISAWYRNSARFEGGIAIPPLVRVDLTIAGDSGVVS